VWVKDGIDYTREEVVERLGRGNTLITRRGWVRGADQARLRPQLKAFHLETEPWLFTIDRRGIIAARLEGAFGVDELTDALNAELG
jgi:hypothetical protein